MEYNKKEDRTELISHIQALEKRLKHLLASEFIANFDEVNPITGEYLRDIHEADQVALRIVEYECDREQECYGNCRYTTDINHAKNFEKIDFNRYREVNKNPVFIKESRDNYRPCIANGENALFHRWENYETVVEASPLIGGHPAGRISYTLGIVELEDGRIIKVLPEKIRFCPGIHREYSFFMPED